MLDKSDKICYSLCNQNIINVMNVKKMKKIHGLQGKSVSYGVVEVKTPQDVTLKPALYIKGSAQYFDFMSFRFYTVVNLPEISRQVYPARFRRSDGSIFLIADSIQEQVKLPGDYFDKLYRDMLYPGEDEVLL